MTTTKETLALARCMFGVTRVCCRAVLIVALFTQPGMTEPPNKNFCDGSEEQPQRSEHYTLSVIGVVMDSGELAGEIHVSTHVTGTRAEWQIKPGPYRLRILERNGTELSNVPFLLGSGAIYEGPTESDTSFLIRSPFPDVAARMIIEGPAKSTLVDRDPRVEVLRSALLDVPGRCYVNRENFQTVTPQLLIQIDKIAALTRDGKEEEAIALLNSFWSDFDKAILTNCEDIGARLQLDKEKVLPIFNDTKRRLCVSHAAKSH